MPNYYLFAHTLYYTALHYTALKDAAELISPRNIMHDIDQIFQADTGDTSSIGDDKGPRHSSIV